MIFFNKAGLAGKMEKEKLLKIIFTLVQINAFTGKT